MIAGGYTALMVAVYNSYNFPNIISGMVGCPLVSSQPSLNKGLL